MKVKRQMKWMLEGRGRQDEERVNRLRNTAADGVGDGGGVRGVAAAWMSIRHPSHYR